MSQGQVDGVIIAVSVLTLALIGIMIASPSSMSGLFTAGSQPEATPTSMPILSQYTPASPSAQPTYVYTGVPIIDQSYYPVAAAPSPTPSYYNQYGGYYQYNQNPYSPYYNYNSQYQYSQYAPSYYPNGTPYYPPGYQNYFNYYPNGTPMYGYNTQYAYCYSNYTGSYPTSINVISGRSPVNVFIDGTYCGTITANGSSFMAFGLSPGYHAIYVSGTNCYKVDSVYTTYQYQTNINVCSDGSVSGGNSHSGDGTYYLYQGDQVTATSGATFVYSSFSTMEYGQSALPMASFSVTPSSGSAYSVSMTVGSEFYYTGGSIRINGAVETNSGKLFGVTVSSSGNLQPSPIGTRTLSGRIVDANGTGISNGAISIVSAYDPQTYMNTKIAGTDGYYSMPYVPDGMYNVTVSAQNHYRRTWTFVQVSADAYATYDIAASTSTATPTPTPATLTSTHYITTQSYLFSVPLASPSVANNTCSNTTVNRLNPFNQSWYEIPMSNMNGNETYWLNVTSPCMLSFTGPAYYNRSNYYNVLYPGWNAVSAPYDGATFSQLAGNCDITAYSRINTAGTYETYNATAGTGTPFAMTAGVGYLAYSNNSTLCAMYNRS
ncbi:MAG: carboxypeptidase-like regulatory domain-containing protein [Candidatus Micrarchaeia archaeon]